MRIFPVSECLCVFIHVYHFALFHLTLTKFCAGLPDCADCVKAPNLSKCAQNRPKFEISLFEYSNCHGCLYPRKVNIRSSFKNAKLH